MSDPGQRILRAAAWPGGNSPVWVHREDERPFALAGLYGKDSDAIITADTNSLMRPVRGRMSVILSRDEYAP